MQLDPDPDFILDPNVDPGLNFDLDPSHRVTVPVSILRENKNKIKKFFLQTINFFLENIFLNIC